MKQRWDSWTVPSTSEECRALLVIISASKKMCTAAYLGVVPYERALKLQQRLVQARAEGNVPDILLLLQHPPVFTIGRFRGEEDIIVPLERLAQEGIDVFRTNRGGGVTHHAPGQLIGYPILDLRENHLGVRQYIWRLEEVTIKLLLSRYFEYIRPCGLRSEVMTSLLELLGHSIEVETITGNLIDSFSETFG